MLTLLWHMFFCYCLVGMLTAAMLVALHFGKPNLPIDAGGVMIGGAIWPLAVPFLSFWIVYGTLDWFLSLDKPKTLMTAPPARDRKCFRCHGALRAGAKYCAHCGRNVQSKRRHRPQHRSQFPPTPSLN